MTLKQVREILTKLYSRSQSRPSENNVVDNAANIYRQNVIDQTPYTPQAIRYLSNLPIRMLNNVSTPYGGFYNGRGITTNSTNPRVFRHEAIHAMDANLNSPYEATMPRIGPFNIDSYGFKSQLQSLRPEFVNMTTKNMRQSGLYRDNPKTNDTEMAAYWGASPYRATIPMTMGKYSSVYIPYSKNINYSPMYPDPKYMSAYVPKNNAVGVRTRILDSKKPRSLRRNYEED